MTTTDINKQANRDAVLQFIRNAQGVSMSEIVAEFESRGISERESRQAAQHLIECGPVIVDIRMRLHWSEAAQRSWEERGKP